MAKADGFRAHYVIDGTEYIRHGDELHKVVLDGVSATSVPVEFSEDKQFCFMQKKAYQRCECNRYEYLFDLNQC